MPNISQRNGYRPRNTKSPPQMARSMYRRILLPRYCGRTSLTTANFGAMSRPESTSGQTGTLQDSALGIYSETTRCHVVSYALQTCQLLSLDLSLVPLRALILLTSRHFWNDT